MGKTLKYVSEFSFPSDKGYSGSAGKQMVKGYARGGSCGPMKKAGGGRVDDPRRPMMDRTIPELIDAINREREMADQMAAERAMQIMRPSRRISQGLRSPRAEMARERAIMGEDTGYAKGGMAMRKQYPTNNGKPMISGPKAAPAPKADMLYSKKEVNAKNLLRDGKAPPLPHAKGSVNMKKGGTVKKAMGGAMPTQTAMRQAAQQQPMTQTAMRQAAQQQKMTQPGMGLAAQRQPMPRPGPQVETAPNVRPMPSPNPRGTGGPGAPPAKPRGSTPMQMQKAKGGAAKVGKVMSEFKAGELHSGSKSGPVVKSRKQAIAIGLSEARKGKK
jgi:hypothetical protein